MQAGGDRAQPSPSLLPCLLPAFHAEPASTQACRLQRPNVCTPGSPPPSLHPCPRASAPPHLEGQAGVLHHQAGLQQLLRDLHHRRVPAAAALAQDGHAQVARQQLLPVCQHLGKDGAVVAPGRVHLTLRGRRGGGGVRVVVGLGGPTWRKRGQEGELEACDVTRGFHVRKMRARSGQGWSSLEKHLQRRQRARRCCPRGARPGSPGCPT